MKLCIDHVINFDFLKHYWIDISFNIKCNNYIRIYQYLSIIRIYQYLSIKYLSIYKVFIYKGQRPYTP